MKPKTRSDAQRPATAPKAAPAGSHAAEASPVPQHATPTFAPVSPLSDKDVHQAGEAQPRTGQSPAGTVTLPAKTGPGRA